MKRQIPELQWFENAIMQLGKTSVLLIWSILVLFFRLCCELINLFRSPGKRLDNK